MAGTSSDGSGASTSDTDRDGGGAGYRGLPGRRGGRGGGSGSLGCGLELRDRGIGRQPGTDGDSAHAGFGGHDRGLTRQVLSLAGEEPEIDARGPQARTGRQDQGDLDVLARPQTGDGRRDLVVLVEEDGGHDQTFMARRTRRSAVSRGDSVEAISMAW